MHILEFLQSWLTFSIQFSGLILFITTIGNWGSLKKGAQAIAERKDADNLGIWIVGLAFVAALYHVLVY
ncbi:MAG: hypothetical protein HYT37_01600 [Candidatus Sungbacteria bacterium]|nr:hypothetical protein [Candidatus Sungbacteria bacterium]